MSLWRRLLQAFGFGGNSIRNSTIIITNDDGTVVSDGAFANGQKVKIDFGPDVERTFQAECQVGNVVSLSKEMTALGLRLRHFDAAISVVASVDVTAPVITVTGPQRIVEGVTSKVEDGFFALTAPRLSLVSALRVSVQTLASAIITSGVPKVRVEARVPADRPLSLEDVSGSVMAKGCFAQLDAQLGYNTTATIGNVTDAKLNIADSCHVKLNHIAGVFDASLGYNSELEVLSGAASRSKLSIADSCKVWLSNDVTGEFSAELGYNSRLSCIKLDCDVQLNIADSCRVDVRGLIVNLKASLGYNSKLDASASSLQTAQLNIADSCQVKLAAMHIAKLDAKLDYNSELSSTALLEYVDLRVADSCKVWLRNEITKELKASLGYNSKLEVGGTIQSCTLKAEDSCKVTVGGIIRAGRLTAGYNTVVTAVQVLPSVNRRGMAEDSQLVITG